MAGGAGAVVEFDRATLRVNAGDYEGAVREYEAFLKRAPDDRLAPVATAAVASLHLRARADTTAALKSLDHLLKSHAGSAYAPEAARMKAECAEARREWLQAAESYELAGDLALQQGGNTRDAWVNEVTVSAANCYREAGEPSKVTETYEKVLAGSPPPEVAATALYRLGESHESAAAGEEAAKSYAQILVSYPSTTLFTVALAKRPLIEEHVGLDWQPITAYAEASERIAARDFEGAIAKCQEVLAGEADTPLREAAEYRQISLETTLSGNFTEGCRRMQRFLEEHPASAEVPAARRALDERWRPIADLEARAVANPEDVGALRALGQAYLQARSAAKAIETLEKARSLDSENDHVWLLLGYAYAQAGRDENAIEAFNAYLDENPNDTTTLNMIGYTYLGRGEAETAIPYFERYAEVAPDEANAHDSLGEGYLNAGRLEDSAREYEKAIELDPSFSNSYFMLGRVYRELGNDARAAEVYRQFLELVPGGPQAAEAVAALEELGTP
jgi:tetratricopeptide (TPR) repeat protein